MSKTIQLYRNSALFTSEAGAIAKLQDATFKASMLDGMVVASRYKEGEGAVKTIFAIYHKDKTTNVVTETIFNPNNVPQEVLDKFNQITINGHKLFGDEVAEQGVVVLDGTDLKVGGTGDHKENTIASAIEALYSSLSSVSLTEASNTNGSKKETLALPSGDKSFQIPTIVKSDATTQGSTATYKMVDYDGNQVGASIEIPADRIFKEAKIGDNADTFDETTGVITPATTPSGEEVLHMVFAKTDGTFEDAKISLENIVFEAEAGDGLQVETEEGHVLSIKIDENSEEYLSVSEDGLKVSGLDSQFEVISAALNDLNDRLGEEADERSSEDDDINDRIDEIIAGSIDVEGTAQQIKVTDGTGTTKVIGFADDAIFDCGEF